MFKNEGGYFSMTTAGYVVLAIVLVAAIVVAAFIGAKKNAEKEAKKFSTRQLVFSAACIALAFVLSYVRLYRFPWGGSVTLFSMFFITIIGYWYGLGPGLMVAFAYSILEFFQDGGSYILTPFQACCDYFFAFTALGLSGLMRNKKNGLILGYLIGIVARGAFHSLGGYLYWMEYMPESFPKTLSAIYPIVYNYSYILAEGILTIVVLSIPAVKNAIARVTKEFILNEK